MDFFEDYSQTQTIEMSLMTKRAVNGFQIPPLTSAMGHKAEDWRGKQFWQGFCQVMMLKSDKKNQVEGCKIKLVNADQTVFAETTIPNDKHEPFVQACTDSSRFFAVLLVNEKTGQKANVGLQFPERNDSFDFKGALETFAKYYREDRGQGNAKLFNPNQPAADFSLKQGEKLNIAIKGMPAGPGQQIKPKGGGLKKLAPPGGAKAGPGPPQNSGFGMGMGMGMQQPPQQQEQQPNLLMMSNDPQPKDNFDMAQFLGSGGASSNQQQIQPQSSVQNDLLGLDFSGGSGPAKPQQQQQQQQPAGGGNDFNFGSLDQFAGGASGQANQQMGFDDLFGGPSSGGGGGQQQSNNNDLLNF